MRGIYNAYINSCGAKKKAESDTKETQTRKFGKGKLHGLRTFGLGLQGAIDLDIPRKENRKCVIQQVVKVHRACVKFFEGAG